MKTKFMVFVLSLLSWLTISNCYAAISCQGDGSSGDLTCINNCNSSAQGNAKMTLTTNRANNNTIQKLMYSFETENGSGSDGLSTLSDQGDLSDPLSHDYQLACQAKLEILNCQALSFSGTPEKVKCMDYLSYSSKNGR